VYLNCVERSGVSPHNPPAVQIDDFFPMLIAAIDPSQEQKLLRLDQAVVSGRPLAEDDTWHQHAHPTYLSVPVLMSNTTYRREKLQLTIENVRPPNGTTLSKLLHDPKLADNTHGPEQGPNAPYLAVKKLAGHVVGHRSVSGRDLYRKARSEALTHSDSSVYWTTTPVRYSATKSGALRPRVVHSDPAKTWITTGYVGGFAPVPLDNADVQFRKATSHPLERVGVGGISAQDVLRLQPAGEFNPRKVGRQGRLNRVPLETYAPPVAMGADTASRRALAGKPLAPTRNIGGYLQQPPYLLTTLKAAHAMLDHRFVSDGNVKKPISVIRVRVAGVHGANPESIARIKRVAAAIHTKTGLDVDITAGSSPAPQTIDLPAGKFGRPELTLREGWTKKGVTLSILQALDVKTASLTILVILAAAGFVAITTTVTVRGRRTEIGVLRCIGWRRRDILARLLGELAVVGVVAGVAGGLVAAGLIHWLDLSASPLRAVFVPVLAVGLALLAGAGAVWPATATSPLAAVSPPVLAGRRPHSTRRPIGLAATNLSRRPGRTLAAAAAIFVGVGALALLLAVTFAFRGAVTGTLLGNVVSLQVHTADYVAVGLVVGLAGLSVLDVLLLGLRERAGEIAVLRAFGWTTRQLARLTAYEAVGIGLVGGLTGAAVGVVIGAMLGASAVPLTAAALAAAGVGVGVTVLACLVPAFYAARVRIAPLLAAE
jgi:ABC-type lipoprotein release transport system permease subunit